MLKPSLNCAYTLRPLKEAPVFFAIEKRQKRFQRAAAIPYQANLHRIAKPDPGRIDFDLDCPSLARTRKELDIAQRLNSRT